MKIVLADDSVLLRAGLARLLEDAGFEVAAQASNAEDLLRKVRAHKPAVAVTDIRMPPTQTDEGLRAAQQIRREMPEVGVMVLSQYIDEGYAVELLQGPRPGSATCSRTASPTSTRSPTRFAASVTAARCSIPRSSPSCSDAAGRTIRWTA